MAFTYCEAVNDAAAAAAVACKLNIIDV